MDFSNNILLWYDENKRPLPWRNTNDPYKIWVSEIMLQQTKVVQALPYYNRFLKEFSSILDLAKASEDDVLKLWQGLGYYSRARNLHYTSQYIVKRFNGKFPTAYDEIISLKGIGEYTASAISSFAFSEPYAVVDGNVIRLLSRYFGIQIPYDTLKGKIKFQELANKLLIKNNPGEYNQAIMEFGALQCTPKNPNCNVCIFRNSCKAYLQNKTSYYPIKQNKLKTRDRYLHFFVINQNNKLCIQKKRNGIWKGLYEFPSIECNKRTHQDNVMGSIAWKELFDNSSDIQVDKISLEIKHKLSHQILFVRFWHVITQGLILNNYEWINFNQIYKYPVSKLLHKYITSSFARPFKN